MDRFERTLGQVFEGWTARVFRTRLQPVQIAKRLIRAMESQQTISLAKTFVPNSYVVSLSPADFTGFEPYKRSLEQDLAETLLGAARERGFTLLSFPTVEIERNDDVARGDVRVSSALIDASGEEMTPHPPELGAAPPPPTLVPYRAPLL